MLPLPSDCLVIGLPSTTKVFGAPESTATVNVAIKVSESTPIESLIPLTLYDPARSAELSRQSFFLQAAKPSRRDKKNVMQKKVFIVR